MLTLFTYFQTDRDNVFILLYFKYCIHLLRARKDAGDVESSIIRQDFVRILFSNAINQSARQCRLADIHQYC